MGELFIDNLYHDITRISKTYQVNDVKIRCYDRV